MMATPSRIAVEREPSPEEGLSSLSGRHLVYLSVAVILFGALWISWANSASGPNWLTEAHEWLSSQPSGSTASPGLTNNPAALSQGSTTISVSPQIRAQLAASRPDTAAVYTTMGAVAPELATTDIQPNGTQFSGGAGSWFPAEFRSGHHTSQVVVVMALARGQSFALALNCTHTSCRSIPATLSS
jgi:hypothetical protein